DDPPVDPGEGHRRCLSGDRGIESVLTPIAPHRPPIVSTGLDYLHSHVTLATSPNPNRGTRIAQPTDEVEPRSPVLTTFMHPEQWSAPTTPDVSRRRSVRERSPDG
ncbi:hypothetical protein RW1_035_00010, partial [Rhodococcus wratislaviensis NBRC 100605]